MITFNDLLNSQVLNAESFGGFSLQEILLSLMLSFLAGLFIYYIYRVSFTGVILVDSFAVSLVALTMITNLMILTITSNLLLSLGMVGALSIVRFRTAVKETMDIIYMFWAIAVGIAFGAGFYMMAVIASLSIGLVLYIMSKITTSHNAYILVVKSSVSLKNDVELILSKHVKNYSLKGMTESDGHVECTYELRLRRSHTDFTGNIKSLQGVKETALIGFRADNLL